MKSLGSALIWKINLSLFMSKVLKHTKKNLKHTTREKTKFGAKNFF
jgi:hypothetical protein